VGSTPTAPTTFMEQRMTLTEYFSTEPRGAKSEMAEYLRISPTWLSLIMNGSRKASPELSLRIELATQGLVTRSELRPDIFL
jgi:DNA-binding transcriptional regulator YdaS (Cro superfamily)